MSSAFVVRYFIQKFINRLNKEHRDSVNKLTGFRHRNQMDCYHILQIQGKGLHENSTKKAS